MSARTTANHVTKPSLQDATVTNNASTTPMTCSEDVFTTVTMADTDPHLELTTVTEDSRTNLDTVVMTKTAKNGLMIIMNTVWTIAITMAHRTAKVTAITNTNKKPATAKTTIKPATTVPIITSKTAWHTVMMDHQLVMTVKKDSQMKSTDVVITLNVFLMPNADTETA